MDNINVSFDKPNGTKKKVSTRVRIDDWTTEEKLLKLSEMARDGLTNEQIAAKVGISVSRFYVWMERKQEIQESIKRGRECSIDKIEESLYQRIMKRTIWEEQLDPKTGQIIRVEKEFVPPPQYYNLVLNGLKRDKYSQKTVAPDQLPVQQQEEDSFSQAINNLFGDEEGEE